MPSVPPPRPLTHRASFQVHGKDVAALETQADLYLRTITPLGAVFRFVLSQISPVLVYPSGQPPPLWSADVDAEIWRPPS